MESFDFKRDRSRSPMDEDSSDRGREKRKRSDKPRAGKRMGSDCRVFVSNIPYESKWQDLKDLFRREVGEVAYVEMFNDEKNRPRGCAIVDFETVDLAEAAIEKMHRFELSGRTLVVKEGSESKREINRMRKNTDNNQWSIGGVPPPKNYGNTYGLSTSFLDSLGINGPLVSKVFVANLGYKITDEDLRELFRVAGTVTNVDIVKDDDEKSRGFGVVEFEHPVQAVQAISMLHNQTYYDRKLSVRMDRIAEKTQQPGSNKKLPPGLKGLGLGLGMNGGALTDIANVAQLSSVSSQNMQMNMPMGMNNMPMNNSMMNNVSSTLNSAMNSLPNMMNMQSMTSMNNMSAMGNNMPNMGMGNMPSSNNSMMGLGNMGGSNVNSGLSSNMALNSVSTNNTRNNFDTQYRGSIVHISNLPNNCTWQSLRVLCEDYGEIRFAEMRHQGTGTVRFNTEGEAQRAADLLDGQRYEGHILDARVM